MEPLDLLDERMNGDTRLLEISQYIDCRKKANKEAENRLLRSQAFVETSTETKIQWERDEKQDESAYLSDGSRVDSAVQAVFSTISVMLPPGSP